MNHSINDDIVYKILEYNFPRMELVQLLKATHYREKYKNHCRYFYANLVEEIFYSNCKNMYYLFLFERNQWVIDDVYAVFETLDLFEDGDFYEISQLMKVIKEISDDLLHFYYYEGNYTDIIKKKKQQYNKSVNFNVCGKSFHKKTQYNIYCLDLVE